MEPESGGRTRLIEEAAGEGRGGGVLITRKDVLIKGVTRKYCIPKSQI